MGLAINWMGSAGRDFWRIHNLPSIHKTDELVARMRNSQGTASVRAEWLALQLRGMVDSNASRMWKAAELPCLSPMRMNRHIVRPDRTTAAEACMTDLDDACQVPCVTHPRWPARVEELPYRLSCNVGLTFSTQPLPYSATVRSSRTGSAANITSRSDRAC